jgi:hypothetical protein
MGANRKLEADCGNWPVVAGCCSNGLKALKLNTAPLQVHIQVFPHPHLGWLVRVPLVFWLLGSRKKLPPPPPPTPTTPRTPPLFPHPPRSSSTPKPSMQTASFHRLT